MWIDLTLCGIMFLLILPLCFLPNLDYLRFNSYLIIGVIIYLAFVVVYTFIDHQVKGIGLGEGVTAANMSPDIMQALPLIT